jgi:hypothetical protein
MLVACCGVVLILKQRAHSGGFIQITFVGKFHQVIANYSIEGARKEAGYQTKERLAAQKSFVKTLISQFQNAEYQEKKEYPSGACFYHEGQRALGLFALPIFNELLCFRFHGFRYFLQAKGKFFGVNAELTALHPTPPESC